MGNKQKPYLKIWEGKTKRTGLGEGSLHVMHSVHRLQNKIIQLEKKLKNEVSQKNNAYQVVSKLCGDLVGAQAKLTEQDLDYVSKRGGLSGNDIQIKYTDPSAANQSLSVVVTDILIDINLATDGASVITSTADDVKAVVDADINANKLVSISVSGTGTNVQAATGATNLTDGWGALNPGYKLSLGL